MKQTAKQLAEKIIDYSRFATVMLAVGGFFYLGVIIPSDLRTEQDLYVMMFASTGFLIGSLIFFYQAKQCRKKLAEMEDNQ
jgi:glucose uptake protein GlcU